jgi:hypothetical protein
MRVARLTDGVSPEDTCRLLWALMNCDRKGLAFILKMPATIPSTNRKDFIWNERLRLHWILQFCMPIILSISEEFSQE